jgi:hypothetical protein
VGFDADAFLSAREPWTLRLRGRTYTGRPVSVLQALAFQRDLAAAGEDVAKQDAILAAFLRLIFPARWGYVFGRDPVYLVMALDTAARTAVLQDFFDWLARILSRTKGTTKATRPSPPSSAPTPPLMSGAVEIEGVAV